MPIVIGATAFAAVVISFIWATSIRDRARERRAADRQAWLEECERRGREKLLNAACQADPVALLPHEERVFDEIAELMEPGFPVDLADRLAIEIAKGRHQ